jgi:hypothetical protein
MDVAERLVIVRRLTTIHIDVAERLVIIAL